MRKLFGLCATTAAGLTLASCTNNTTNEFNTDFDTDQLLATSMYTIGGALDSVNETSTGTGLVTTSMTSSVTSEQYQEINDTVKSYVDSVDKLLGTSFDSYFNSSSSIVIDELSNFTDVYELSLDSGIYIFAYNKVDEMTETDDDETETTANLVGNMYKVVDGAIAYTYDLVGFEESEVEDDEVENKFFIKASDGEGNYIKYHVKTEVETEEDGTESELKIELKTSFDGVQTHTDTEVEIDNKGYEVTIEDKVRDGEDSYMSEYEYFRSVDGEFDITYSYKSREFSVDGSVEVTIDEEGNYVYTFVDGDNNRHRFEEKDRIRRDK